MCRTVKIEKHFVENCKEHRYYYTLSERGVKGGGGGFYRYFIVSFIKSRTEDILVTRN